MSKYTTYIAWVLALVGMLGSLYLSDIRHIPPCNLCWYQRILLYPLVLIIPVGIMRKDKKLYQYVLPLTILGMIVAFYHILLQNNIISESIAPCTANIPCNVKSFELFNFLTIPMMSFLTFCAITMCMFLQRRSLLAQAYKESAQKKKGKK
jgi:disulfide bond formation protein DsbB